MRNSEQLGSNADAMQVDQGEENTDGALHKTLLKLEISNSFLTSIRLMLAWDRSTFLQSKYNDTIKYEELKTAKNQLTSVKSQKKVSTDMHVLTLTVGNKKLTRRVDIPFSGITSLLVCFDHMGLDTLRIEAISSPEYFCADNPPPGMFTIWGFDDTFPETKFVFLEIEKGVLEKVLAKLLYLDPRLQRAVEFVRGNYGDQRMYQDHVHAHTQQINTSTLQPLPSVDALHYIGGRSM
ncbi:hypothetical protein HU200_059217 [Digitaria exilis]|uniref:Uncharacterized protein n=1 Tax=Digitaria exilis TaxID=1010633 RepID=A0A835E3J7_9POAL|nr:hypothetical protein HU200_059217 [Digitaria exilis]